MKAIMISIQPQWIEKILNGEKTIEIRKTMPKCELPCKVYIYCTKSKPTLQYFYNWQNYKPISEHSTWASGRTINVGDYGNGKVVAEFTLKQVETLWKNNKNKTSTARVIDKDAFEKQTCMTWEQYCEYHKCKNFKYPNSYAWHIDDLKIYDKPKELNEFRPNGRCLQFDKINITKNAFGDYVDDCYKNSFCKSCCKYYNHDFGQCDKPYKAHLTRPPQSWCYVEELENE